MTSKSTSHLRLHVEPLPAEKPTLPIAALSPLLGAFERATGWQLRYDQSPPGIGEVWSTTLAGADRPGGRLVIAAPAPSESSSEESAAAIELQQARPLALAIAGLVNEVNSLKHALWQREAELAAGVPVAVRQGDEPHLAERLEAVLKSGTQAVRCQAAGLYLLDEYTTELKLRAAWGLPQERLLAAARPLRGSVADLEALVGHAVVLEDTAVLPHWRCPENFPAAVCVPVSSPSIPLGTLWVYSDTARDFAPEETNLLEIIAGRLAADLEREMLLAEGTRSKQRARQLDTAARWLAARLPSVSPLLEGYEVAGWTERAGDLGGDFFDWTVVPDGRLALAVGASAGTGLEAALGTAALQMALKAHGAYPHAAGQMLQRVNESLAMASAGDHRGSLAYALVSPDCGAVELALAGDSAAACVGNDARIVTATSAPLLGDAEAAEFTTERLQIPPGGALVLISGGVRAVSAAAREEYGEAAVLSLVRQHARDSAEGIAKRLRKLLLEGGAPPHDLTVLVLKRRRAAV